MAWVLVIPGDPQRRLLPVLVEDWRLVIQRADTVADRRVPYLLLLDGRQRAAPLLRKARAAGDGARDATLPHSGCDWERGWLRQLRWMEE